MLSTGSIKEIVNGTNVTNPVLQILAFKALAEDKGINNKYRLLLTDGKYYFEGFILLGNENEHIKNGTLKRNTIIELNKFYKIESQTRLKTIIAIFKITKIKDASKGCFSQELIHYTNNSEGSSKNILLNYVSLKDLCSEIKSGREYFDCRIKIKVEYKSPIKTWKKNDREGIYTVMKFQDNDDKEQKIKAINFNEKLNDKIQTDMVYYLKHFKVGRKKELICDDDVYVILLNNETNIISALKPTMCSEEITNSIHYMNNSEESSQKILLNYVSLKDLCSEIKSGRKYFDCTIKIKVQDKSPVKTWKKNDREGIYTVMTFQDNDDEEQKIKAINFNEKLNDKIQTDMVCYLTHFKAGRKKVLTYDDDVYEIVLNDKTNIIPVLKATMCSEEITSSNQKNIYSEEKHSNNFSEEDHHPLSCKHHAASNKSDIQEIQQENSITDSNTVVENQNWINLIIAFIGFLIIIIALNSWVQRGLHLYLPEK